MTEMVDVVVRGFGSEIRHAVRVPAASLHQYEIFGSEFTGIPTPLIARCGRRVRSVQAFVVVMPHPMTCRDCQRWVSS